MCETSPEKAPSKAPNVDAPLDHVVQEAPVVDLPLGRAVFPGLLQGPHHVTRRRRYKSVEVAAPRDAPIQAGFQVDGEGRMHGCERRKQKMDPNDDAWCSGPSVESIVSNTESSHK